MLAHEEKVKRIEHLEIIQILRNTFTYKHFLQKLMGNRTDWRNNGDSKSFRNILR